MKNALMPVMDKVRLGKQAIMTNLIAPLTALLSIRKGFYRVDDKWRMADMVFYRDHLAQQWLNGEGIEIGALHNPIQIKSGISIRYVDYKTKAENQSRYPELEGLDIVETDIVDDGFILNIIPAQSLDFIIANHALEHSPDPYGTLLKWKSKLRPHGILYFALPIAEKCYDHGRPITTVAHLLEDHRLFTTLNVTSLLRVTEAHLREFLSVSDTNIRRMNQIEHILDDREIEKSCANFMFSLAKEIQNARTYDDLITAHVHMLNRIYDIHYHTFSPTSLYAFATQFCDKEDCELVECKKSGGVECIVLIRNRSK